VSKNKTHHSHDVKPDSVYFSTPAGNIEALRAAINEMHLSSGDVTRVGNMYYVRGLKPGKPINNQK
jgi:hypothetical protein